MAVVFVIAILGALSAFLLASSLIPTKSPLTRQLEELANSGQNGKKESRVALFERVFNEKRRGHMRQQLFEAGWYQVTPAKMGLRIVGGAVLGLTLGVTAVVLLHNYDLIAIAIVGVLAVFGAYFPMMSLNRAVRSRKSAIFRALPDLLDMVATTVQAGLALNAALAYAGEGAKGPLAEEVQSALSEIRMGRSRADALKAMADRVRQPELSTTVTAIVQAERLGANLSAVLEQLAEEARNRRMVRAEEVAAVMPVKMVFPMALFMLPALFVMIFGAVAADYFAR